MSDADAVAEAICEAEGHYWLNQFPETQDTYRRMARAAMLGLTDEWCVEMEIGPPMGRIRCEPTPFPPRGELGDGDLVFSRLVSPWTDVTA
jgi:hypothetical protein